MNWIENFEENKWNTYFKIKHIFIRGWSFMKKYKIYITYWGGLTILSAGIYLQSSLSTGIIVFGIGCLVFALGLIIAND